MRNAMHWSVCEILRGHSLAHPRLSPSPPFPPSPSHHPQLAAAGAEALLGARRSGQQAAAAFEGAAAEAIDVARQTHDAAMQVANAARDGTATSLARTKAAFAEARRRTKASVM